MPLLLKPALVRVPLTTEGEWVDVKERPSAGDRTYVQDASMRQAANIAGDLVPSLQAALWAAVEVGVVAWSFETELTPENLRLLTTEDFDLVKERIDELWATRTDDERKNSSGRLPAPSTPAGRSRKSSGG